MLDRVVVGDDFAVLLDGASAFTKLSGSPVDYVDALERGLTTALVDRPGSLRDALEATLRTFVPGPNPASEPSSTVSIVGWTDATVEVLVLGDSPVHVLFADGDDVTVEDHSLALLTREGRRPYEQRLATGAGFDDEHRRLVSLSQHTQFRLRNTDGGYWIAATDPRAAGHALVRRFPLRQVTAVVLLSDGVTENLRHSSICTLDALTRMTEPELAVLLADLDAWERQVDPSGLLWPRSKVSDDKSVVVLVRAGNPAHIVGGDENP